MASDRTLSRFTMALPAPIVRAFGKLNVPVYRATRGRLMNSFGRAPILLLTTAGRRSGKQRTAPVVYLEDGERIVVIGSNAGNVNEPGWSHNLKSHPDAEVEIGGRRRRVHARVTDGEERAALWRRMNDQYAGFEDYERRTSRDIAVFVLEPS
jgi:deazaflavin-dependent oxidoreductase (nitroreductase family)